jgi:hypothetical protein
MAKNNLATLILMSAAAAVLGRLVEGLNQLTKGKTIDNSVSN